MAPGLIQVESSFGLLPERLAVQNKNKNGNYY